MGPPLLSARPVRDGDDACLAEGAARSGTDAIVHPARTRATEIAGIRLILEFRRRRPGGQVIEAARPSCRAVGVLAAGRGAGTGAEASDRRIRGASAAAWARISGIAVVSYHRPRRGGPRANIRSCGRPAASAPAPDGSASRPSRRGSGRASPAATSPRRSGSPSTSAAGPDEVTVRLDQGGRERELRVGWFVNGTGPAAAVDGDPLLRGLVAAGLARPDPLRLGRYAYPAGAAADAAVRPHDRMFALGPPLRGLWYETTAIPEIRAQAAALAPRILRSLASAPVPAPRPAASTPTARHEGLAASMT